MEGPISDLTKQEQLAAAVTKSLELQQQRRESIAFLQGSMDQLRLAVKYLVFDLEATRRERLLTLADNAKTEDKYEEVLGENVELKIINEGLRVENEELRRALGGDSFNSES